MCNNSKTTQPDTVLIIQQKVSSSPHVSLISHGEVLGLACVRGCVCVCAGVSWEKCHSFNIVLYHMQQ